MRRTQRGGWPYSQPPNVQFEINLDSPQSKGLEAWWPTLGSRGANVLRDMAASYDGSIPATFSWGQDGVAGPYINVPSCDVTGIQPDSDQGISLDGWPAMTLAVWCRLEAGSVATYPGILGKTNCYVMAYKNANATLYFRVYGTGGETGWITHASSFDVDHLYVLTYDSADAKIYEDGILVATDSDASGPVVDNVADLTLIARENTTDNMRGRFYEARFYDRAFTAAQVWQLQTNRWELTKPLIRRFPGWRSPAPPPVGGHMTLWGRYWGP